MSQRRTVALVAGVATLFTSTVLSTLFALYGWFYYCLAVTIIVTGVAMLARAARFPVWAQALAMLSGLTVFLTFSFPSGHEIGRIIPTGGTISHFGDLLSAAGKDIRELSVPVTDHLELDFLVAAGIGLVAVAVDLLAVGLRHPALAGLPLLAVYSVPVAIHSTGVSWIPFTLGAAGYLWLLITDHVDRVRRWGRRFRGDGRDVDSWEPSPLAASGRRVGFAGLVIAIVVPFLIPGMNAGLLQRLSTLGSSVGGGTGTQGTSLSPFATLQGQLGTSGTKKLFTFTTSQKDTDSIPYLRTAVADQVTDAGFQPRPPATRQSLRPTTRLKTAVTAAKGHKYKATVTTQNLNDRYLTLFSNPVQVNPPQQASWYYDTATGVVSADRTGTDHTQYNFDYEGYNFTAGDLRGAAEPRNDTLFKTNTRVPPNAIIADRVNTLTRGKTTEYDKVMAIYDSFSTANGFSYQLSTKTGSSGSDIVDFLTAKQGYCEQYAAAMAWMVRQARIPARVVVGYRLGTENSRQTFQVTNKEAHAWVEVWFPGFGWVPFDPTPGGGLAGAQTFEWTTTQTTGPGSQTSTGPTSNPTTGAETNPTEGVQHGGNTTAQAAAGHHQRFPQWPLWTLGALVLLALLAVPATRRAQLRRNRRRLEHRAAVLTAAGTDGPGGADPPGPGNTGGSGVPAGAAVGGLTVGGQPAWQSASRRAAHAAWDELMDTLVDFGMPVDEAETPRATAERLIHRPRLTGRAADSARLLARAEERARYAREPLATGDLGPSFRAVRTGLADHVTRRRRLGAVLFPRSVARRWRAAVSGAFITAMAAGGNAQHRLLRTLSVRRLVAAARSSR
jgi:transglutaminase-like putative cysteine protease